MSKKDDRIDRHLRLECLRIAHERHNPHYGPSESGVIVRYAEDFWRFVERGTTSRPTEADLTLGDGSKFFDDIRPQEPKRRTSIIMVTCPTCGKQFEFGGECPSCGIDPPDSAPIEII